MPPEKRVADELFAQIRSDSPDQLEKAGDMWKEVSFQFYYGNNDGSIDAAVATSVARFIAPRDLPSEVWKNMEGLIGPDRGQKKATSNRMPFSVREGIER